MTISNSALNGVLSLDVIKESMFNEELRRKEMEDDNSKALVVENMGRSKGRVSKGRGNSHSRSKSRKGKEIKTCHYSKKPGHIKKYLFKVKKEHKRLDSRGDGDDKNTTKTVSKSEDEVTLICATSECHHVDGSDLKWLVDTGASYH